jgi:hypothetical protein
LGYCSLYLVLELFYATKIQKYLLYSSKKLMNRVKIPMDLQDQVKKVEGLEAIKSRAEKMASEGADAFTVRGFINEGAKQLAFKHPDEEAFRKAARAAARQVKKNK